MDDYGPLFPIQRLIRRTSSGDPSIWTIVRLRNFWMEPIGLKWGQVSASVLTALLGQYKRSLWEGLYLITSDQRSRPFRSEPMKIGHKLPIQRMALFPFC